MAQLLTELPPAGSGARRPVGLAAAALIGLAASLTGGVLWAGAVRAGGVALGACCLVLMLAQAAAAARARRREEAEVELLGRLAAGLPHRWYLLTGLTLPGSWGGPLAVWAVVVGPGGLAVIQPCSEAGEIIPYGAVWVAGAGRTRRAIPSPAAGCQAAVQALREALGDPDLPLLPIVVLTDLRSVYHPARTGALVVGAPHAADAVRRCLSGQAVAPDVLARVVAQLCRYHGR